MSYVYITSEKAGQGGAENDLFTVGFYDPSGKFVPESDHTDRMMAANRASFLNGQGALVASKDIVDSLRGCIRALQGLYPWPIAGKWTQKEAREAARQAAEGALRKAGL